MTNFKLNVPLKVSPRVTKILCNHILISVIKIKKNEYKFEGLNRFPISERGEIKDLILKKIEQCPKL
jgi:hypothetical protein